MMKKIVVAACLVALASVAQAQLAGVSGPNGSKQTTQALDGFTYRTPEGTLVETIDISGIDSGGDDPISDVVLSEVLPPGVDATVVGIGWDVFLDAFDPSWQSEATIDFNGALGLTPFVGIDEPGLGVASSSGGILDLTMVPDGAGGFVDLSFPAVGGVLDMTFFESFDDSSVAPDGMWLAGSTLTIEYAPVPEPSAIVLLGLAGLGLVGLRRR